MLTSTSAQPATGARSCAPWGMLATIDLHGCDAARVADAESIRRFVPAVIDAIGMRAHGPLMLDRFGDGELEGWSAMQFIEPARSRCTPTRSAGAVSSTSSRAGRSLRTSRRRSPSSSSAALPP